jgi:hypothetical protein
MLILNSPSLVRKSFDSILEILLQKGFLAYTKKNLIWGKSWSLEYNRLCTVLHYIVAPNFDEEGILKEIEKINFYIDHKLIWCWISEHEEISFKIWNIVEMRGDFTLLLENKEKWKSIVPL